MAPRRTPRRRSAPPSEPTTPEPRARTLTIPIDDAGALRLDGMSPAMRGKVKSAFRTLRDAGDVQEGSHAVTPGADQSPAPAGATPPSAGAFPPMFTNWLLLGISFAVARGAQALLAVTPEEAQKVYLTADDLDASADGSPSLRALTQKVLDKHLGKYFSDTFVSDESMLAMMFVGAFAGKVMALQPSPDATAAPTSPAAAPPPAPPAPTPADPSRPLVDLSALDVDDLLN